MPSGSPAGQTFCVQLAAGQGAYLPTARAVAGRSYGAEVASNLVGPDGGQDLVNETLAVLNDLLFHKAGADCGAAMARTAGVDR